MSCVLVGWADDSSTLSLREQLAVMAICFCMTGRQRAEEESARGAASAHRILQRIASDHLASSSTYLDLVRVESSRKLLSNPARWQEASATRVLLPGYPIHQHVRRIAMQPFV